MPWQEISSRPSLPSFPLSLSTLCLSSVFVTWLELEVGIPAARKDGRLGPVHLLANFCVAPRRIRTRYESCAGQLDMVLLLARYLLCMRKTWTSFHQPDAMTFRLATFLARLLLYLAPHPLILAVSDKNVLHYVMIEYFRMYFAKYILIMVMFFKWKR